MSAALDAREKIFDDIRRSPCCSFAFPCYPGLSVANNHNLYGSDNKTGISEGFSTAAVARARLLQVPNGLSPLSTRSRWPDRDEAARLVYTAFSSTVIPSGSLNRRTSGSS